MKKLIKENLLFQDECMTNWMVELVTQICL